MTAPQNPFIRPPRTMRATPDMPMKATPRMESKLKRESKLEPSKPPATTAYSNMASLLYPATQVILYCPMTKALNEFVHSVKKAKPHSFSFKQWGSTSLNHTFPPGKGIGEPTSEWILSEWGKMSRCVLFNDFRVWHGGTDSSPFINSFSHPKAQRVQRLADLEPWHATVFRKTLC